MPLPAFARKLLRPCPRDQTDEITDRMIDAAKYGGARSAREAAEMAQGRRLSDPEWEARGEPWRRRWY